MGDNNYINMKSNNYPKTTNELDKKINEGILADFDSEDGPIMVLTEQSKNPMVLLTIGNTTIHISEASFLVLTKAVQQSAKKILDL